MTTPPLGAHWTAVRELYAQAREQPAGEREAWLLRQAAEPSVRDEVRSLLAHARSEPTAGDDSGGDFLAAPLQASVQALDATLRPAADGPAQIGRRIGAWQLVRLLGSGGMGDVFEAHRIDGSYAGRAAIKLLKRGMDSAAVLQRFAQERQALAQLNHPHIARLLDAGAADDGLPYFVMECIDGVPIDQALRGQPLERQIEVFLQLTDAVAHAHRKLLVHRDLKPGNVLVTPQGQVRLLDFGIAKALDAGAAGDGHATLGGRPPYTPNYASPEQVRGETVHTATDIYSLGVLLYQLLTGVRPTGRDAGTPQEAAQRVLTEAPTRPSSLPAEVVASPAWPSTRRRLQGDLDNVLLKALEKNVDRRYPSVDALAADLRSYLAGHPVSARAATPLYVAAKFVRRHRVPVGAALLLVLALAGGLGATAWQAREARIARDAAQARLAQLKRLTRDVVFRFGDAVTNLPGGLLMQEALLAETLGSVEGLLKTAPDDVELALIASTTHARIAELYSAGAAATLNRPGDDARHADRAIALALPHVGAHADDWRFITWYARARAVKAQALRLQAADPAAAMAELRAAHAALEAAIAQPHPPEGHAQLLANRGNILLVMGQTHEQGDRPSLHQPNDALAAYALAERDYESLLADEALLRLVDRLAPPGDTSAAGYMRFQLGTIAGARSRVLALLGRLDEARASAQTAVRLRESELKEQPSDIALQVTLASEAEHLAAVLLRLGQAPQALQASGRSWTVLQALLQRDDQRLQMQARVPRLAATHAWALERNGRCADALPLWATAHAAWQREATARPDAPSVERAAWAELGTARCQWALGRREPARAAAQRAQAAAAQALSGEPAAVRAALLTLAHAHALLSRADATPAGRDGHRREAITALEQAAAAAALDPPDRAALDAWRQGRPAPAPAPADAHGPTPAT